MKITLYVKHYVDWQTMDETKFLEQKLPFDLKKAKSAIDQWNTAFKMPYFQFRQELKQISENNWQGFQRIVWKKEELLKIIDTEEECYVAFCDDDDWYNPAIHDYVNRSGYHPDIIQWQPAAFLTSIIEPKMEFAGPYFDTTQRRRFYTNNWIIKNSALRRFVSILDSMENLNVAATQTIENVSALTDQGQVFGMVNKNLGSLSSLLHAPNLFDVLDKLKKKPEVPYPWITAEIDKLFDLYEALT